MYLLRVIRFVAVHKNEVFYVDVIYFFQFHDQLSNKIHNLVTLWSFFTTVRYCDSVTLIIVLYHFPSRFID